MSNTWPAGATKSVIWRLIHAAGEAGTTRMALLHASGKSGTAVDWHLTNLHRDGYIQRPNDRGLGRWVSGPKWPPVEGLMRDLLLDALDDCPAGMSDEMLCGVLDVPRSEAWTVLQQAEAEGLVKRILLPAAHGGGKGWRLAPQPGTEPAMTLPVFTLDIDHIHRVRREQLFRCALDGGCLSMTLGGLSFKLDAAQTAQLKQCLQPETAQ
jgi:hypothetical protein